MNCGLGTRQVSLKYIHHSTNQLMNKQIYVSMAIVLSIWSQKFGMGVKFQLTEIYLKTELAHSIVHTHISMASYKLLVERLLISIKISLILLSCRLESVETMGDTWAVPVDHISFEDCLNFVCPLAACAILLRPISPVLLHLFILRQIGRHLEVGVIAVVVVCARNVSCH